MKARNRDSEEWTTISDFSNLDWSSSGKKKVLYFYNNKSYNQYRLENLCSGDPDNPTWKLGAFDLSSYCTIFDIPSLAYEASPLVVYKYERMEAISEFRILL